MTHWAMTDFLCLWHPREVLMSSTATPTDVRSATLTIRPWVDPVVDDDGFDPRSRYVELFWLGVLGPTATWLVRRLVAGLEQSPEGYDLDLDAIARAMGLSYSAGRASPFSRALQRCVMFGLAHPVPDGMAVRRRVPPVSTRHLQRMPLELQQAHEQWQRTTIGLDELTRAHRLATTMLDLGDDTSVIEHHLIALGVTDAVASAAADNAYRLTQAG
jgi:hypothetical protein